MATSEEREDIQRLLSRDKCPYMSNGCKMRDVKRIILIVNISRFGQDTLG